MPGWPFADGGPSKKIKSELFFLLNELDKTLFFYKKSKISDEIDESEKFFNSLNPIIYN